MNQLQSTKRSSDLQVSNAIAWLRSVLLGRTALATQSGRLTYDQQQLMRMCIEHMCATLLEFFLTWAQDEHVRLRSAVAVTTLAVLRNETWELQPQAQGLLTVRH